MLYYESPYENWCKENFRTIVAKFPDSLKHGIFIVTTTYSTEKASLNANIALGQEGDIGFEAKVTPMGEIAPSVGFCYSSDAGAWIRTKGEVGISHWLSRTSRPHLTQLNLGNREMGGVCLWTVFQEGLFLKREFPSKRE